MAKRGPAEMTDEHKEALAVGRSESRAVRRYLEALEEHKPKRGRKRTPDSIAKRLEKIQAELDDASPVDRLQMIQERLDLQREVEQMNNRVDLTALEDDFVGSAKGYSDRKGISYAAWRELGVTSEVLKRAGIGRAS